MSKVMQIERLPEIARNELYDFYEFLMQKYTPAQRKSRSVSTAKNAFFQKVTSHSFILPENYNFDRDELYER